MFNALLISRLLIASVVAVAWFIQFRIRFVDDVSPAEFHSYTYKLVLFEGNVIIITIGISYRRIIGSKWGSKQ